MREYVEALEAGRWPVAAATPADPAAERFFVGLRLASGVEVSAEEEGDHGERFRRLIRDGLLERAGTRVRLTPRGVLLSNEVFQEFLV